MRRVGVLLGKEFAEFRCSPSVFLPVVFTSLVSLVMPVLFAVLVPQMSGESLANSRDLMPPQDVWMPTAGSRLSREGAAQAWMFGQFLVLLLLTPVGGSMAIAAFSVIGEKQARTLEPLLASPLATWEFLAAKVLGALLPAVTLAVISFGLYVTLAAILGEPGVYLTLLGIRPLALVMLLGPLAGLTSLLLAVIVSSRVNDPRTAQQVGILVILPVIGLLVVQLVTRTLLTVPAILGIAAGLMFINSLLLGLAVRLFGRETILTRWK